jgi:hypothetical protein
VCSKSWSASDHLVKGGQGTKSPDRGAKGTSSMMAVEGIGSYLQSVSRMREADEICGFREEKLATPMKGKG